MNITKFWELIDQSRKTNRGSIEKQIQILVSALMQQSPDSIIAFDNIFRDMMAHAYHADLWEAADIIGCGCSDDGFRSFRAWLIGQGQEIYEKSLANPETLADIIEVKRRGDTQDGRIAPVAYHVYKQKVGRELPIILRNPPILIGKRGDETTRKTRFPRLAAQFGNCDEWWEAEFNRDFPTK